MAQQQCDQLDLGEGGHIGPFGLCCHCTPWNFRQCLDRHWNFLLNIVFFLIRRSGRSCLSLCSSLLPLFLTKINKGVSCCHDTYSANASADLASGHPVTSMREVTSMSLSRPFLNSYRVSSIPFTGAGLQRTVDWTHVVHVIHFQNSMLYAWVHN